MDMVECWTRDAGRTVGEMGLSLSLLVAILGGPPEGTSGRHGCGVKWSLTSLAVGERLFVGRASR